MIFTFFQATKKRFFLG